MVLPNYEFEKGKGGINGISFGVNFRGSKPANDNSFYVEKLFFDNEKDSKEFYAKLSLRELTERFLTYLGHLPNLIVHTRYDSNGNKLEDAELLEKQKMYREEIEKIKNNFAKIDFLKKDGLVANKIDFLNLLGELDKFIAEIELSKELLEEKEYVLSIMSKLRELIANKLEEDSIV